MLRTTTLIGVAAAVALFGGIAPAQAVGSAPTTTTATTTTQPDIISQTTVLDPTHSFAMTAKPSVKATPYWGEPKAG